MNKILFASILSIIGTGLAFGATPWWEQSTVCKLNPSDCYSGMGAGFDSEMWDATAGCWGMKYICPDATTTNTREPILMGREEIKRGTGIKVDFDTNLLSTDDECFGRRKTAEGGTMASVNGKFVNVWCNGILNNADETLENGEITYGPQPTCSILANDGYVGVENGRCYGKYFDPGKYIIECGSALLPTRLIVLNGADYNTPTNIKSESDAERMFNTMYSNSKTQKIKYFKK